MHHQVEDRPFDREDAARVSPEPENDHPGSDRTAVLLGVRHGEMKRSRDRTGRVGSPVSSEDSEARESIRR
jgi:hypothetical protein